MGTPRGIRNNNPGNIRNSDATDWKGEVPATAKRDNTFEEFTDMAHGYRALIKLLQNYRHKHRCQTIADFISRWAPRSEYFGLYYACLQRNGSSNDVCPGCER